MLYRVNRTTGPKKDAKHEKLESNSGRGGDPGSLIISRNYAIKSRSRHAPFGGGGYPMATPLPPAPAFCVSYLCTAFEIRAGQGEDPGGQHF